MIYPLSPPPAIVDPMIQVCDAKLTPEHLAWIIEYGDSLLQHDGNVGFHEASAYKPEKRICKIGWMPQNSQTKWVYAMLGDLVQNANSLFWNYDVAGFYDQIQYTTYGEDGHFGWHMDKGHNSLRPQRKLSISLLLTDPSEYEGGDFQIFDGQPITIATKAVGTAIVFPSFVQHRVTPVTKGVRKSLVGWTCGPKFR